MQNDSAVMEMGDDTLEKIAQALVTTVRERHHRLEPQGISPRRHPLQSPPPPVAVRRPARQEAKAVELVLEQAELLATEAA